MRGCSKPGLDAGAVFSGHNDVDLYACWLGHGSTDYDGGYLWESFKKFLGDSTFPPIRCRYTVEEMPVC